VTTSPTAAVPLDGTTERGGGAGVH
jgi:hypothetical protein